MAVERVTEQLQRLGMSGYEAKAYVALISSEHPLNGYEVAKRSGVPRSTVYETLGKLVDRGAAYEVRDPAREDGRNSTAYVPLPHNHLLDRLSRHFANSVSELRETLPAVAVPSAVHLIHNLSGRQELLTRAADVVAQAQTDLFISSWPEELEAFDHDVRKAEERQVDVSMMSFGEPEQSFGHTFVHRYSSPDVVLDNLGCRLLVVVADREQALIGGFVGDEGWGAYTDNPAVVLVAVEYIRHDIAMHVVMDHVPGEEGEEARRFWASEPELVRLRSDRGAPMRHLRERRGG